MSRNNRNFFTFEKSHLCEKLYSIGIFFLLSAPFISSILVLLALTLNFKNSIKYFNQNKTNYILIATSFLMLLSCLDKSINHEILGGIDPNLSWFSLANWIPLFLVFIGSQEFLKTKEKRVKIMRVICYGSIPLLASGIGQYYFNWTGPFQVFNGLIIWYQRPILGEAGILANGIDGLTGVFNNANTAGDWLLIVLPMQIYFLIYKNKKNLEKLFFFLLTSLSVLTLVLTNSRSAILGLSTLITFLLNLKFVLFLIFFSSLIYFSYIFNFSFLKNVFNFLNFEFLKSLFFQITNDPRITIWKNLPFYILDRPFFGYGASSAYLLFITKDIGVINHTHNMFGELSINYGLPSAILIMFFIFTMFIKVFKTVSIQEIFRKKFKDVNNVWIISSILVLYTQIIDFTYYDLRISILFWTLIAGLRNVAADKIISD